MDREGLVLERACVHALDHLRAASLLGKLGRVDEARRLGPNAFDGSLNA